MIVLTFPDSEEEAVKRVLSALADEATEEMRIGQERVRTFPGLEIRLKEQSVLCGGKPVCLSHYEFFTLCYLAEHPGWVFTQQQIYEAVWEEPGENCGAAVSSVISQLRRKLWPENPKGGYLRTVKNSGYKFEV